MTPQESQLPEFARRLLHYRTKAKLSIRGLAAKSGVSHASIGNYERGQRRPKVETTTKLAAALGVSPAELDPYLPFELPDDLPFGSKGGSFQIGITHDLANLALRAMLASGIGDAGELSRRSRVPQSQISRLLSGDASGPGLTEATWEAIFDALSPAIRSIAAPNQLPRRDWEAYIAEKESRELLASGDFPPEIREVAAKYSTLPPDQQTLISQLIDSFQTNQPTPPPAKGAENED